MQGVEPVPNRDQAVICDFTQMLTFLKFALRYDPSHINMIQVAYGFLLL